MRKLLRWLAPIFTLTLLWPAMAGAANNSDTVDLLNVTANLSRANQLDLTEQITYDFGTSAPHTVTRTIQTTYQDDQGSNYPMRFHLVSASRDQTPLNLPPAADGPNAKLVLAPGTQSVEHFTLHYTLSPVAIHGYTSDIFKLNILGAGWDVPIQNANIAFNSPGLTPGNLTCITALNGAVTGKCTESQTGSTATVVTSTPLSPTETLLIVCSFPSHSFTNYLDVKTPASSWLAFGLGAALILAIPVVIGVLLARRSARKAARKAQKPPKPAADTSQTTPSEH